MSDDNKIRTGLWKNDPGKPVGYGGKITITQPGEYFVDLYKNDRKKTDREPDLNLLLKLKGTSAPQPATEEFIDDDINF